MAKRNRWWETPGGVASALNRYDDQQQEARARATTEAKGFVTFRLEDSVRDRLEELAREHERSLSAEIRLAIREYLKNGEKP